VRPLAEFPAQAARSLVGVFTDIDDTLTTEGSITADALQALHNLHAAGLVVIPITGRGIGWCEPFVVNAATAWPVQAMVAENGALAYAFLDKKSLSPAYSLRGQLSKLYQADATTRSLQYQQMQAVASQVLREVPGAQLARDSAGRETDIAFDHSEFAHLNEAQIAQVLHICRAQGMQASVSSIHINAWFGAHNKWQGAQWILRELFGRDLRAEIGQWLYVGDSSNDELMFQHFNHSVGVANIARFAPRMAHLPRYVTTLERGAGFAQLTQHIVKLRT
jgi:HAD superfamily hydrolase (TIGR01484 family)